MLGLPDGEETQSEDSLDRISDRPRTLVLLEWFRLVRVDTMAVKIRIPHEELLWSFARSSGPGGQNVNKTNSKAILSWDVLNSPCLSNRQKQRFTELFSKRISSDGLVTVSAQEFRDQARNVDRCMEKLYEMIDAATHVPKIRKATKPSRAAREKRIGAKRRRSEIKKLRGKSVSDD